MKRSLCAFTTLAALGLVAGQSHAANTFTNAADNDITNAANWSGGTPAFGGAIAARLNFNGTTTYSGAQGTSTFNDGSAEARPMSVDNGGHLTVTGGTINVDPGSSGAAFITNGSNDSGSLTIDGGTMDFGGEDVIMIFNGSNSTADFTINSGSITLDQFKGNSGDAGSVATYNLNGGVVNFRKIGRGNAETAVVNYNGATLQTNSDSFVTSSGPNIPAGGFTGNVQAGGLIWDSNGFDGFLNTPLTEDAGSTGGGITKLGAGALTLVSFGADSTYTGATSVQAGILRLNGNHVGNSAVGVDAGATLSGAGVTNGAVTLNSGSISAQHVGGVNNPLGVGSLAGTGTVLAEFDSDTDKMDLINVAGNLDLTSLDLNFADVGAGSLAQDVYVIATYGSLTGATFNSVSNLPAGYTIDYAYEGNGIALVPEPASLALLGLGGLSILSRRRD